MEDLCDTLRRLSTESHKYWAKKDRRQQKSSFRDILRAVQVRCFFIHYLVSLFGDSLLFFIFQIVSDIWYWGLHCLHISRYSQTYSEQPPKGQSSNDL